MKKLHTVNEGLKKFAHVNKKAFEQYNNFTKQRDQLLQRRQDLDSSAKSIEELVEVLDQRKDEAIERTFKQVALNFEEVFEKLVPAGKGRLIIQKRIDQVCSTFICRIRPLIPWVRTKMRKMKMKILSEHRWITTPGFQLRSFVLIFSVRNVELTIIQVSFNSKVDEGLRIQQLSGGQKSLVALATGTFLLILYSDDGSNVFQFSLSRSVIQHPFTYSTRYALSGLP